jgi:uncharacterized membrane protein
MNIFSIRLRTGKGAVVSEVFLASLLAIFLITSVFSTICYAERAAEQKRVLTYAANLAAEKIEELKSYSETEEHFNGLTSSQAHEFSDNGNYSYFIEITPVNSDLKHVRINVYASDDIKTKSPSDMVFDNQRKLITMGTYLAAPRINPDKSP